MEFEIRGSGTANVTWNFTSNPTGGNCRIIDLDTNTELVSFDSPSGGFSDSYTDTKTSSFVITSPRRFRAELRDTKIIDNKLLYCIEEGTMYLLHGFIKKSQETPKKDIDIARDRQKVIRRRLLSK